MYAFRISYIEIGPFHPHHPDDGLHAANLRMSIGRGPVSHTIVAITGRATETCSSQMPRPTSRSSIRPAAWCVGRYCGGGRPRSTGRPTMAKSLWANPEAMSASTQRVARYGSGSPHRVSVVFSDCPPAKFFCANLIRAEWYRRSRRPRRLGTRKSQLPLARNLRALANARGATAPLDQRSSVAANVAPAIDCVGRFIATNRRPSQRSPLDEQGVTSGACRSPAGSPLAGSGNMPTGVKNVPVMDVTSVRLRATSWTGARARSLFHSDRVSQFVQ
jgi:hypothetical protein